LHRLRRTALVSYLQSDRTIAALRSRGQIPSAVPARTGACSRCACSLSSGRKTDSADHVVPSSWRGLVAPVGGPREGKSTRVVALFSPARKELSRSRRADLRGQSDNGVSRESGNLFVEADLWR